MKTLSSNEKENLKHTYQILCELLTKITRQNFKIQTVDDNTNIADFNIICNNTWQVLYPKMQEDLLEIKDYDTMHILAKERKFYEILNRATSIVCDIEKINKPHYIFYLDKSNLNEERLIIGLDIIAYNDKFEFNKKRQKFTDKYHITPEQFDELTPPTHTNFA